MSAFFDAMRDFSFASVTLRLAMALVFGGMIGFERAKKRRAAGFRTYMLVCMGAALAMLLGQYESELLTEHWSILAEVTGNRVDVVRFGAQVINGIGFLGAGTVIVTGRQEVKGLTTAAGLWASACAGLAIGAGFYECALVALVLISLSITLLPMVETIIVERARNMNIYVEFTDRAAIGDVITCIKGLNAHIFEIDICKSEGSGLNPGAILYVQLEKWRPHAEVLAMISRIENVTTINEV